MDKILQFLNYNKFPLVTKLTDINSASVHSSPIKLQVAIIPTYYFSFKLLSCFISLHKYYSLDLFPNKIMS